MFGLFWGTLLASFASSIGATAAFLIARVLLRDWVQSRFGESLKPINEGIEKDGGSTSSVCEWSHCFRFFW